MQRMNWWMGAGFLATVLIGSAPLQGLAAPKPTAGSCSDAVVVERHYGQPHATPSGSRVEEVYLTLSDGQRLDGPAQLGTTGFFWDYTPGNKVGVCVEAVHPLRLRVDDRITGAVLWFTPRRRSHQGAEADQRHRGVTLNPGANMPPVGL